MSVSFYLGANSHRGFASLYGELFPPGETPVRVFLLKGGPGTGKSTIMRRAAETLERAGKRVERIWCSSDNASLDGVRVIGEGKAILDATAPHVGEPELPGAVEDYVSLCGAWDHAGLAADRREIARLFGAYRGKFAEGYKSLAAAKAVDDVLFDLALSRADTVKLRSRGEALARKLGGRSKRGNGTVAKRFLGSISGHGESVRWETVTGLADEVIALDDEYGLAPFTLSPVLARASELGKAAFACYDPLDPGKLAHIILPELSLAFITVSDSRPYPFKPARTLRLAPAGMRERGTLHRAEFLRATRDALVADAAERFAESAAFHAELELRYTPHVDFSANDATAESICASLL